jgi:hypothetical protein
MRLGLAGPAVQLGNGPARIRRRLASGAGHPAALLSLITSRCLKLAPQHGEIGPV